MKIEVNIRRRTDNHYQFFLTYNGFACFYNSSMSNELDVEYEDFKKRLLKIIDKRKIVKSANEFVFEVDDSKELYSLVDNFKNEFIKELTILEFEGVSDF